MNIEEAKNLVKKEFPFDGYIDNTLDTYGIIWEIVKKYLKLGSRILDFGCGPCDKLAILQKIGYQCSACDDLQDYWHGLDDNIEKIISYTKKAGIDFRLLEGEELPYNEASFDMVMVHDVLEHLHNSPRNLLNNLIKLIKDEGFLFVTVPNLVNLQKRLKVLFGKTNLPEYDVFYWHPEPWRGHIREYVKNDLEKLMANLGMTIVEIRGEHIMTKGLKKRFPRIFVWMYFLFTLLFPGLRDSWLIVARKPVGWKPRKPLSKEAFIKIIAPNAPFFQKRH